MEYWAWEDAYKADTEGEEAHGQDRQSMFSQKELFNTFWPDQSTCGASATN